MPMTPLLSSFLILSRGISTAMQFELSVLVYFILHLLQFLGSFIGYPHCSTRSVCLSDTLFDIQIVCFAAIVRQ